MRINNNYMLADWAIQKWLANYGLAADSVKLEMAIREKSIDEAVEHILNNFKWGFSFAEKNTYPLMRATKEDGIFVWCMKNAAPSLYLSWEKIVLFIKLRKNPMVFPFIRFRL